MQLIWNRSDCGEMQWNSALIEVHRDRAKLIRSHFRRRKKLFSSDAICVEHRNENVPVCSDFRHENLSTFRSMFRIRDGTHPGRFYSERFTNESSEFHAIMYIMTGVDVTRHTFDSQFAGNLIFSDMTVNWRCRFRAIGEQVVQCLPLGLQSWIPLGLHRLF